VEFTLEHIFDTTVALCTNRATIALVVRKINVLHFVYTVREPAFWLSYIVRKIPGPEALQRVRSSVGAEL
jgi:hypothetical protein